MNPADKLTQEESNILEIVLNRNLAIYDKLSQSISDLSETMTQVRISIGGMQGEIKSHSEIIQHMSEVINELKDSSTSIAFVQSQINDHEKTGLESRKRINERLDCNDDKIRVIEKKVESIDSKGKVDLIKVGTNLFLYVFGGSGLFALLFWIFEQFISKK